MAVFPSIRAVSKPTSSIDIAVPEETVVLIVGNRVAVVPSKPCTTPK